MARFIIERTFPTGLAVTPDAEGARGCEKIVASNLEHDVSWVHSYVSLDRRKTFCVYDAPSPEAIRQVARRNGLPVDAITEVRVLDPYFFH